MAGKMIVIFKIVKAPPSWGRGLGRGLIIFFVIYFGREWQNNYLSQLI